MAHVPFMLTTQFPPYILGGVTTTSIDFSKNTRATALAKFASQLSGGLQRTVVTNQVHGTTVQNIDNETEACAADGIYTFQPYILLGVVVADCAGVLIYDNSTQLLAAIHSGWRGTASGIVPKFINEKISCNDIHPQHCTIWISPCARVCCYQVGEEVIAQFSNYPSCYTKITGTYYLDIANVIRIQIKNNGIPDYHIYTASACTICDNRFHSHRRDASNAGRALAFITRTARNTLHTTNQ